MSELSNVDKTTWWDDLYNKAARTTKKLKSWDPKYMVIERTDLLRLVRALNRDQFKEVNGVLIKNAGVKICKRTLCSRKFIRTTGHQKFCSKNCQKLWFKAHTNETQKTFRRAIREGYELDIERIDKEIKEAMKEY